MKTPSGIECHFFFGDYHRGRDREVCRLLNSATPPLEWKPPLCDTCPVPRIQRANSCEHLQLKPILKRPLPFLSPQVHVKAFCTKTRQDVKEPQVGCGECHQLPEVFLQG